MASQNQTSNRILASLNAKDYASIKPHLTRIELPVREQLESSNRPVTHFYFLESGMASIVASSSTYSIESGVVGNEGIVGVSALLGADHSPHETFMQLGGYGWRIEVSRLRQLIDKHPKLRRRIFLFAHILMVQMSYTNLAGARNTIEERLARWLLMVQDRNAGPTIVMTHEFLALMLGVNRPVVTITLASLKKRDLIATKRGKVTILDRDGLEAAANGAYGVPEAEYRRQLKFKL